MSNLIEGSPNELQLLALGGFNSIGGSAASVRLDGVSVLFDCGINAGFAGDAIPSGIDSQRPDIIVISHAHIDHVGALPVIARNNPNAFIISSLPTKELARLMLNDAMRLSAERSRPIYSESEINSAIDR